MTIAVVCGAMATKARNGGNAVTRLAWLDGFAQLGFDAWFVEQHASRRFSNDELAWLDTIADEHGGLRHRMCVIGHDDVVSPQERDELCALMNAASIIVNISGHLSPTWLEATRGIRVFLDDDPGFTQAWEAAGSSGSRVPGHDLYLTYGTNIGRPECAIPTVARDWMPIVPPVAIADWSVTPAPAEPRFTTVGTWRGPFGGIELDGNSYGVKVHEFRKFLALPTLVDAEFDIAMAIDSAEHADIERLHESGWKLTDPRAVTATPGEYRAWIQASTAEVSAAQGVYAGTNSGWVSDRTACYLASGRPAIVQDTGAERAVPVGDGLLTFRNVDEAAACVRDVLDDYEHHAAAARKIAEEYFDATAIVGRVCERAGVAP
jgi:hypothetical protein